MKERFFQEFLKQIEPFRELWRSVRFVCYAGKLGSAWVLVGLAQGDDSVPGLVFYEQVRGGGHH